VTVTAFSKTLRALDRNRTGGILLWVAIASIMTGAILSWMFLARVRLDEVTDEARIEIDRSTFVVQAPVTGRVIRVNQALGKEVRAGDVLVEIDSSREQLQVTQERSRNRALEPEIAALQGEIAAETSSLEVERAASRAAIDEARARILETAAPLRLAELERKRALELSGEGLIPKRDLERAVSEAERLATVSRTAAVAVARLETEQQKREMDREIRIAAIRSRIAKLEGDRVTNDANVHVAEREVANRRIFAPVCGRIGEAPVLAPGSVLREGDRVAAIIPSGGLRVVAQFAPAAAQGRIRPGQRARMRLSGYPWTEFGTVECEVDTVASEDANGKVRVELSLRDAHGFRATLRHGMPGSIEVEVERTSPLTLLLRQTGQWVRAGKTP
jgi:membrane fusion protein (multidrug efflux system)